MQKPEPDLGSPEDGVYKRVKSELKKWDECIQAHEFEGYLAVWDTQHGAGFSPHSPSVQAAVTLLQQASPLGTSRLNILKQGLFTHIEVRQLSTECKYLSSPAPYAHTHTHTHTHTHENSCTHKHTCMRAYMQKYTHAQWHTDMHTHTQALQHTKTHGHAKKNTHTKTNTHLCILTHMHTHTARMQTLTHIPQQRQGLTCPP